MNFKNLSDDQLNLKVKSLVISERRLTKEILLHIVEVDNRKLYLGMAYASLFDYLTKEIGYSDGAAQRRIDAARLIRIVPEVSEKIESGHINLAQISKVQKVCRQIKKQSGKTADIGLQKSVLEKLENKTSYQSDLILAQEFQMEVKNDTKIHIQKDESQRLEMTLTKEEMELLKKAQSLLSNKTGGGLKDTILEMAKKILNNAEKQSASKHNVATTNATVGIQNTSVTTMPRENTFAATMAVEQETERKLLTVNMKKQILKRDQVCQFKDLKTGKMCGATHFLEIDHIAPKYLGGKNNKENLRVLCKNHNQYRFQKDLFS